tara:strand:- start:1118 stop:1333 length:216 start_codon:yes stop_codon:yes gene_type:complete
MKTTSFRRAPVDREIELRVPLIAARERSILVEGRSGNVELFLAHVEHSPAAEDGTVRLWLSERLAVEKGLV